MSWKVPRCPIKPVIVGADCLALCWSVILQEGVVPDAVVIVQSGDLAALRSVAALASEVSLPESDAEPVKFPKDTVQVSLLPAPQLVGVVPVRNPPPHVQHFVRNSWHHNDLCVASRCSGNSPPCPCALTHPALHHASCPTLSVCCFACFLCRCWYHVLLASLVPCAAVGTMSC